MQGLGPTERERVEALRTLGLPRRARADEVRTAYLALARQLHPDVNPGGTARFQEIAAAYELLRRYHRQPTEAIDPARRQKPPEFDERWWAAFGERV
jgi:DnaJ-domain-containing protein 1